MPELPEVEVVKLFLEDRLLHQKITNLEILTPKSFVGDPQKVIGQNITGFSRIGKQLSIRLSNGLILLVHLKMTGQLILDGHMLGHPTNTVNQKSLRLIFSFGNKLKLLFNDQRKFGWVQVFNPENLKIFQSRLGRDVFDPEFTPEYLFSQLKRSRRPVKIVLLDQQFVAGVGNIYANDALFLARIHPSVPANLITLSQSRKIHRFLLEIMRQSVLAGGSTARDNKYLRPDGTIGGNQFYFRVYQRAGEPCLRCRRPIRRISLGGRGTFFCPHCQVL